MINNSYFFSFKFLVLRSDKICQGTRAHSIEWFYPTLSWLKIIENVWNTLASVLYAGGKQYKLTSELK